jgi:hypothetical protein
MASTNTSGIPQCLLGLPHELGPGVASSFEGHAK